MKIFEILAFIRGIAIYLMSSSAKNPRKKAAAVPEPESSKSELFADPKFENCVRILNFELGNNQKYNINPYGPLNPFNGLFFCDCNLLCNKRMCSANITLDHTCMCAKKCECSGECNCEIKHSTTCIYMLEFKNDRPLEFYKNQGAERKGDPFYDYTYDCNACLANMFIISDPEVYSGLAPEASIYPLINTLVERKHNEDEIVLAALFLLAEGLWMESVLECTSKGNGVICIESKIHGFEFKYEYLPLEAHNKEILCQAISFFSRCGTDDAYKKIIAGKKEWLKVSSYNANEILECPEFLIQCYLHIFAMLDTEKNEKVIKVIFDILQGIVMGDDEGKSHIDAEKKAHVDAERKSHSNVKTDSIESKIEGNPEGVVGNQKNAMKKKARALLGKYFIKKNTKVYRSAMKSMSMNEYLAEWKTDLKYCKEYYGIIQDFHKAHCMFPFTPGRNIISAQRVPMYCRAVNSLSVRNCCMDYTEMAIFHILCTLFYDKNNDCFNLSKSKLDARNDGKDIYTLFTKKIRSPRDIYTSGKFEEIIKVFHAICEDMPHVEIHYFFKVDFVDKDRKAVFAKNKLYGGILNSLYVIAYITGRHEIVADLNRFKRNSLAPSKREELASEIHRIATTLFRSLAYNKNIRPEILIDCVVINKNSELEEIHPEDRAEMFGTLRLYAEKTGVDHLYIRFKDGGACFEYLQFASYPEIEMFLNLEKQILGVSQTLTRDLIRKNINYVHCVKFRKFKFEYDQAFHKINDRLDILLSISNHNWNFDYLLEFADMLHIYSSAENALFHCCSFLDKLRGMLPESGGTDSSRRLQLCNFMVNFVLNNAHHYNYSEKSIRTLFLLLYGLEDEPFRQFSKCNHYKHANRLFKEGDVHLEHFTKIEAFQLLTPNLLWYVLNEDHHKDAVPERIHNFVEINHVLGAPSDPHGTIFEMIFYSILFFPERRSQLAFLRSQYPKDLSDLAGLFSILLYNKRSEATMIPEVYYIAQLFMKTVNDPNTVLAIEEIRWKHILDFSCFEDINQPYESWERMINYSIMNKKSMNDIWKMCNHLIENTTSFERKESDDDGENKKESDDDGENKKKDALLFNRGNSLPIEEGAPSMEEIAIKKQAWKSKLESFLTVRVELAKQERNSQ